MDSRKWAFEKGFEQKLHCDVIVLFTGKVHMTIQLHKLFLCQSPFFALMFAEHSTNVAWNNVALRIEDDNITDKSLVTVFGSLYSSEIHFGTPDEVIAVIATARMFNLDWIIERAEKFIIENVSESNFVAFYRASIGYSMEELEDKLLTFLALNFCLDEVSSNLLNILNIHEMKKVLMKEELVVRSELSLYNILKEWIVNRITRKPDPTKTLLEQDEGKKFVDIFVQVRLENMIVQRENIDILKADGIVPDEWITNAIVGSFERLQISHQLTDVKDKSFVDNFSVQSFRRSFIFPISDTHREEFTFGVDKTVYGIRMRQKIIEIYLSEYFDKSLGQIVSTQNSFKGLNDAARSKFSLGASNERPKYPIYIRVTCFIFGKCKEAAEWKRSEIMKLDVLEIPKQFLNLGNIPVYPMVISIEVQDV